MVIDWCSKNRDSPNSISIGLGDQRFVEFWSQCMKSNTPLISVIIPAYNRAEIIAQTLESIFAQAHRPLELLVIDDGSVDRTVDAVEAFADLNADDTFIVRCIRQMNRGPSAARNHGFSLSQGEYICFFDSDDIMAVHKLSAQLSAIQRDGSAWCGSLWSSMSCTGEIQPNICRMCDPVRLDPATHFLYRVLVTPTGLYHRSVLEAAGPWREDLRLAEDLELGFRILCLGRRFSWVMEPLSHHREVHGSLRNRCAVDLWNDARHAGDVIEEEVRNSTFSDRYARDFFGRYYAYLSRNLYAENRKDLSREAYRLAIARVDWKNRWKYRCHKTAIRCLGPNVLERLGLK